MSRGRQQHSDPVVQTFLQGDPEPQQTLRNLAAQNIKGDPKTQAIQLLLEITLGLKPKEDLPQAEAAYQARSSVDLHLLFLISLYRALFFAGTKWPRIKVIRDRIFALVSPKTPPEIVGWATLMHATTQYYQGDTLGALRSSEAMTQGIDPGSAHYRRLAWIRALHYFQRGMGSVACLPDEIHDVGQISQRRIREAMFVNHALTGNLAAISAADIVPGNKEWSARGWGSPHDHDVACYTIELMAERHGSADCPWLALIRERPGREPAWVTSTRHLLNRQPTEALHWARTNVDQQRHATLHTVIGFDEYTLIRAELAAQHTDAARRLLLNRTGRGCVHYIDDFFYARVEHLTGNHELAAHHMARVLRAVQQYEARGRLNFEMHLACDLSPLSLAELTARAMGKVATVAHGTYEVPTAEQIGHARPQPRGIDRLVYASSHMSVVRDRVLSFAGQSTPVLITGETGTGKELIATALHETGPRRGKPFVAINCAALSDTLIESELFGHERGAFTGAEGTYRGLFREAGGGTVLLDEIGDISPRLQTALLRVLETGEIRPVGSSKRHKIGCRILAATNADLAQRVQVGAFRQDLLFRLHRLHIHVPPLRERQDDVVPLASYFLNMDREQGQQASLSAAACHFFQNHRWTGNVRELRNTVERMRILSSDKLQYDIGDTEMVLGSLERAASPTEPQLPRNDVPSSDGLNNKPPSSTVDPAAALAASNPRGLHSHAEIARFLDGRPSSLRRLDRLRGLVKQFSKFKTIEVARILGVSRHTAAQYLKKLCAEGVIQKVEPTASRRTHYYAALPLDD